MTLGAVLGFKTITTKIMLSRHPWRHHPLTLSEHTSYSVQNFMTADWCLEVFPLLFEKKTEKFKFDVVRASAKSNSRSDNGDDFYSDSTKISTLLKYLKRTMDRYMRSTVSLLGSRCLMPSLRFAPRNQKRSELFQNSTTKSHVWSAPRQTHHQNNNVADVWEDRFSNPCHPYHVAPASTCGHANVQRKGQHWCLMLRRRRKKEHTPSRHALAINTPG